MKLEETYYASPRWSWEILDCAMPMTFDTYSNCAHQCLYCFAFFQRAVGEAHESYLAHKVSAVNVERVKRMFLDPDKYAGTFAAYIKQRFVLQWGGLSDGFDWYEKKFRKSLELLEFFKEIDYPVSISTKGTWFLDDPDYIRVLKDARNTHWKYSIITDDDDAARKLEAGTPPPAERFEALRRLKALGVGGTTLRFRPFVIGVSDRGIDSMFDRAKAAGVDSITTEFLCIERRAGPNHLARYKAISEVVGYDVWDYYRANSFSGSGLMRLNYDLKRPYMDRMKAKAAQVGIPFFVSDAHHKEQSAAAGCCGLPSTGPLSNYNKGQFAEAILIAKAKGRVSWSDIAPAAEWLKSVTFRNAEGFNTASSRDRAKNIYMTMFDYMRTQWNTPKSWSSPARYFGGALVPGEVDDSGDIVYLYNEPYVERGERITSIIELTAKLADQRDSMTADGGDFGHVAYPIFIPTRKRPDIIAVTRPLDEARLTYTLVVEPQEEEAYRQAFPQADFLILPESDKGLWYARQYILDYCRGMGVTWHWQLDDNIKGFYKGLEKTTARAALSYAESLTGQYENLAMVSLDYKQFAFRVEKPYSVNRRNAASLLVNAAPGATFRTIMKQDLDFELQRLSAGWSTILVHRYAMDKPTMGVGSKGGCRDAYRAGKHIEAARQLAAYWPNTSLVEKPLGTDVKVNWRAYPNTLKVIVGPVAPVLERVRETSNASA